jgi:hypothetical protein
MEWLQLHPPLGKAVAIVVLALTLLLLAGVVVLVILMLTGVFGPSALHQAIQAGSSP